MFKNKIKIKKGENPQNLSKKFYTVKAEKLIIRLHLSYKFFYAIRRELSSSYAMRSSFYTTVNLQNK
jgi:hypothetical protein